MEARLKRVHIEVTMTEEWLVDAGILNRLRKCQQDGMVISIVNTTTHWDVLAMTNLQILSINDDG
jgi:hypothetical protein